MMHRNKPLVPILILLASGLVFPPASRAAAKAGDSGRILIAVDASTPAAPLRPVWPFFGFDECNFAVSPEARKLMRTLASSQRDTVFLRSHFLLNTGNGVPALKWGSTNAYTEDYAGTPVYDWTLMDGIMDSITGSGCLPLVEIGFMPKALSVRPEPYQHVYPPAQWAGWAYPPKDHAKWAGLIRAWAAHSRQRYGADAEDRWLWELWNEPDIFYWQGSFEDYCRLFDHTENALHAVLPRAALGGPHSTGPAWPKAGAFLKRFLEHCARGVNAATGTTGTRLDYVGFHSKGSTRLVDDWPRMNLGLNLDSNRTGFGIVAGFPEYKNTPIIIGECDPEGLAALSSTVHPANGYRNGSAYAAYEAALMKHTLDLAERTGVNLKGVLTWAFMFDGKAYFEGYRTLSTNGLAKPVLNVFKMLGQLEGNRVPLTSGGALGVDAIIRDRVVAAPDIDGLAASTGETTRVLLWNYHDDIKPAGPAAVRLEIQAPPGAGPRARLAHYRIDDSHSNAFTRWLEMGSPQKPTGAQIVELEKAAELGLLSPELECDVTNGRLALDFELPRHGVSLIEVRWTR
jgi:xylan 1,4-beta-xylosidase